MVIEQVRNIVVFIFMLGGLILLHEAAHFLAAKRLGVYVEEFGMGLPPRAVKLGTWGGTIISLNWIPLGGFVRLKGEVGNIVPGSFSSARAWKRLVILAAGSAANIAAGYLIFVIGFSLGWPDRVEIVQVFPDSPAESAGLQAGDVVLEADGFPVHTTSQLVEILNRHEDEAVDVQVQRGEAILTLTVTPHRGWHPDDLLTGIEMVGEIVRYPVPQAAVRAANQIVEQVRVTFSLPFVMMSADHNPEDVRLISPVGLKQVTDQVITKTVETNALYPMMNLVAVISTALGIANLFPFPALDGGRIVFVLAEVVGRKRINPRFEQWVHVGGMIAIYALTIYLIVQDVIDPIF